MTTLLTRRRLIEGLGGGLGAVGLARVVGGQALASQAPHFRPRAKRVIQLFMNGGPFQADLFDPKPALTKYAGQRPKAVQLRTENETGGLMAVPFKFRPFGQSGLAVSELLPPLAGCLDDIFVIRSVATANPNPPPPLFLL